MCGTLLTRNAMKRTCSLVAPASNIEIRQSSTKLDAPLKDLHRVGLQQPGSWLEGDRVGGRCSTRADTVHTQEGVRARIAAPIARSRDRIPENDPWLYDRRQQELAVVVDDRALLPDSVKLKARAGQAHAARQEPG